MGKERQVSWIGCSFQLATGFATYFPSQHKMKNGFDLCILFSKLEFHSGSSSAEARWHQLHGLCEGERAFYYLGIVGGSMRHHDMASYRLCVENMICDSVCLKLCVCEEFLD